MDTLASLALATEPPNENILLRQPHSRFDYIISKVTNKSILENVQTYFWVSNLPIHSFNDLSFRR
jgi:hypothetical protein